MILAQVKKTTKQKGGSPIQFLREAKNEFEHVTWPTRREAINLTAIVVGASVVAGVYLGALDYLFTWLLGFVI